MNTVLGYYLLAVNVFTWLLFGIDKWKARHSRWRIPELTLLGFALVGGSFGAWLGMKMFHHKTQHRKFFIGIPLLLVLHLALFAHFYFVMPAFGLYPHI